jgi:tRNA pseudouridine55 synthase
MDSDSKNIKNADFQAGKVLLIDKPLHWTSFDAVNKLRYAIKHKTGLKKIKVGHAGTLDPMATGLLIICTGKFTPRINEFQDQPKEYTGIIALGATRPSYDMESEIDETFDTEHITSELIEQARLSFLGEQEQFPPIFSAIKVDGKPIYLAARRGEDVEVKARQINILEFEITQFESNNVHFRVKCSKGTYIRSLAYDFGKAVKSGAYLASLRRTKIGDFDVDNALSIDDFLAQIKEN